MAAPTDKAAILASLPVRPDEDPFVVAIGGFYRRWFNLLDDLQPLLDTVTGLEGSEDELWVPAWSEVAQRFEKKAEAATACGDSHGCTPRISRSKNVLQPCALSRALSFRLPHMPGTDGPT
jgi:hypothetical protein